MNERALTLDRLPESLIDDILCRLPIDAAARTSTLSRSWRNRWRSIQDLDLSGLSDPIISVVFPLRGLKVQFKKSSPIYSWLSSLSGDSAAAPSLRRLTVRGHGIRSPAHFPSLSLNFLSRLFPNLTHLDLKFCGFLVLLDSFNMASLHCAI